MKLIQPTDKRQLTASRFVVRLWKKDFKMIKTFDISWKNYLLPNIHNEGWRFVGIFAAVTALLAIIWEPLGWLGLVLTIWCYYFFRDPQRIGPEG